MPAVTGPTNTEQYMLELVNDARLDPLRNADRFISSYSPLTSANTDIQAGITQYGIYGPSLQLALTALTPVGALAWNNALATAAESHSAAMITARWEDIQVGSEAVLSVRLTNAGYTATSSAENVSAYAASVLSGHAGLMINWGVGTDGMVYLSPSRSNLMNGTFNEIGIDVTAESTTANPLGPNVITQDLASRGKHFVLGVAYTDSNSAKFYTAGEGLNTLVVRETATNLVTTGTAGGYSLEVTTGAKTFTLTGGGLASAVTVAATIGGATGNLKIDVIGGHILQTSGSVTVTGTAIDTVRGLDARGQALTTGTGVQTIVGTRGPDTINAGVGADTMQGGKGNDIYTVDNTADIVTEVTDGGTDTVNSSANFTLGNDIEILNLTGTGNLNGTGNAIANTINGTIGANVLSGDLGADTLNGGLGDDTLNGGGDNDTLNGEGGNDALDGGSGADAMLGGAGNDSYVVNSTLDRVYETTTKTSTVDAGGTDTISSSVTLSLAAYNGVKFVENLTLTGITHTSATGNDLANTLTGNAGINTLSGGNGNDTLNGGAGNDTFNGGQGNDILNGDTGLDRFDFRAALGSTNIDTINSFVTLDDFIRLDDAIFTAAGALGTLAAGAFATGTAATQADDRIIYNPLNGHLSYDADGSGGASVAVHFATFVGLTGSLSASDFLIV